MSPLSYVLVVPGMPFNGATIPNGLSLGGSETAAHYVARELAARGHRVLVFCNLPNGHAGAWDGVAYQNIQGFEQHCMHTPHDVLIVQRIPEAFKQRFASKINLWWTHDLALRRYAGHMARQTWNIDKILAVSNWHAGQVAGVYGIVPRVIDVLPNGVDHSFFALPVAPEIKQAEKRLAFIARPERGLENLVSPGGIMDRLAGIDPEIKLQVAGYDNTQPDMAAFYESLWNRCRNMPNVELLGPLGKREVAILLQQAWLYVYPTTFEDTSCMAVMEAQVAGTPVLASPNAALPETLGAEAGVAWVNHKQDGQVDRDGFVAMITSMANHPEKWRRLHGKALTSAYRYTWQRSVDALEETVRECFADSTRNADRLFKHYLHTSDIMAARDLASTKQIAPALTAELDAHYGFAESDAETAQNAKQIAEYERGKGLDHGLGDTTIMQTPRYNTMSQHVAAEASGTTIIDYGCGQGHFVQLLAAAFPDRNFIGVDIADASIDRGRAWLTEHLTPNLRLCLVSELEPETRADLGILAEVLEHVVDPAKLIEEFEACIKPGGRALITTPYGPWEAQLYGDHPFRAHLHHHEPADLMELLGTRYEFNLRVLLNGATSSGESMGCLLTTYRKTESQALIGKINYERKHTTQAPQQTLSVCMIVSAHGDTLAKCLKSVKGIASEIIIGIDAGANTNGDRENRAWAIAEEFGAQAFAIESPLTQGFDSARNATIARATGDWILWIDDDETLLWPERVQKYLRLNAYDGYAVQQHHFAVEPLALIKTDLPCRIFRNGKGARFFGLVHEHPETQLNKGLGSVWVLPDLSIGHNGYLTEDVRRARFQRNLPLMIRDREKYPDRRLGRFLWVRDLVHLGRYELERNQQLTPKMIEYANNAVALWRELLTGEDARMAIDAMDYYSEAVRWLTNNQGIDFAVGLSASCNGVGSLNGQPPPILRGRFLNVQDIELLTGAIMKMNLDVYRGKYL